MILRHIGQNYEKKAGSRNIWLLTFRGLATINYPTVSMGFQINEIELEWEMMTKHGLNFDQ